MKFIFAKVNRYKIPPFVILLVVGLTSIGAGLNVLPFMLIIAFIEILIYLFFVSTIGWLIKNDLQAISLNLSFVFLGIGGLEKIMHWPGADLYLIIGKVLLIACLIIGCIIIFSKKV